MHVWRLSLPAVLQGTYSLLADDGRLVGEVRCESVWTGMHVRVNARSDERLRAYPAEESTHVTPFDPDTVRRIARSDEPTWQGAAKELTDQADYIFIFNTDVGFVQNWSWTREDLIARIPDAVGFHRRFMGLAQGSLRASPLDYREELTWLLSSYPGMWRSCAGDWDVKWDAARKLSVCSVGVSALCDDAAAMAVARMADETIVHGLSLDDGFDVERMRALGFVRRPDGAFRPRKAESCLALLRPVKGRPRTMNDDVVRMIAHASGW